MSDYMADWSFEGTHSPGSQCGKALEQGETLASKGHSVKGRSCRDESELSFCEDSQGLK